MSKAAITLEDLYIYIENRMKFENPELLHGESGNKDIAKLYKREQELKLASTEGSMTGRDYARNKVYFILGEMKNEVNVKNIDQLFQQYHVDYFNNIYSGSLSGLPRNPVDAEICMYFSRYSISHDDSFDRKLMKLSQIIYQELFGYSILDELIFDSSLNEVACNRYDYIWIQYKGIKRRIPNESFKFKNEEYYRKVIENRMVSTAREEMNSGQPFINCTLANGFRVSAARPPLSKQYIVSVRLFGQGNHSHEQRSRFMQDKMIKLVEILASKGRRNIAIIGEQGAGKTTAADELIIKNLGDNISIGLAEYTHELDISGKHPDKNVIELQYGKQYEPTGITEMFFRFNRDIVIYGEVRNAMEAFEMIKAMLRQARGSLFTFHSSSVQRMIHDLRQLLMQTGYYTDFHEAQFDVADAVDIVIHIKLDRNTGQRFVYKISEVLADETNMSYCIRDLFTYCKEAGKYLVNSDGVSSSMLNSCMEYEMNSQDVLEIMDIFDIKDAETTIFEMVEKGGGFDV